MCVFVHLLYIYIYTRACVRACVCITPASWQYSLMPKSSRNGQAGRIRGRLTDRLIDRQTVFTGCVVLEAFLIQTLSPEKQVFVLVVETGGVAELKVIRKHPG